MQVVATHSASASWRDLYRAALFEADRTKLASRIQEARTAVVLRGRELFNRNGNNLEEAEDLEDALYALQALSSCLKLGTRTQVAS